MLLSERTNLNDILRMNDALSFDTRHIRLTLCVQALTDIGKCWHGAVCYVILLFSLFLDDSNFSGTSTR